MQCCLWHCSRLSVSLLSKVLTFVVMYNSLYSFSTIFFKLASLFTSSYSAVVCRSDMLLPLRPDVLLAEDDVFVGGVFRPIFGKLCDCLKLFVVWYYSFTGSFLQLSHLCRHLYQSRADTSANSSKVRQCFNQLNSSHGICYCESFRSNQLFGTEHSKITCKRPSNTK